MFAVVLRKEIRDFDEAEDRPELELAAALSWGPFAYSVWHASYIMSRSLAGARRSLRRKEI